MGYDKKKVQIWSSPAVGSKEKIRRWDTIFSLMPRAPILFNHIYLFTKKYQNITHKLLWASINIAHSIGLQIFHILLSKIGSWYKLSQKVQKTHILSNIIIIIYLNPNRSYEPKATYPWQYFKNPGFKSMAMLFYQWNSNL